MALWTNEWMRCFLESWSSRLYFIVFYPFSVVFFFRTSLDLPLMYARKLQSHFSFWPDSVQRFEVDGIASVQQEAEMRWYPYACLSAFSYHLGSFWDRDRSIDCRVQPRGESRQLDCTVMKMNISMSMNMNINMNKHTFINAVFILCFGKIVIHSSVYESSS